MSNEKEGGIKANRVEAGLKIAYLVLGGGLFVNIKISCTGCRITQCRKWRVSWNETGIVGNFIPI
ncbi:hypothetical protein ACSAZK_09565 [Methanosarcina sp. Mfa9]|uniref:hypothetical protein n=1 Tax=Methanosarcina sp. Mfa9 TaxID=3439063 RepID=UPI003F82AE60